jgi:hypothetical protein
VRPHSSQASSFSNPLVERRLRLLHGPGGIRGSAARLAFFAPSFTAEQIGKKLALWNKSARCKHSESGRNLVIRVRAKMGGMKLMG